MTSTLRTKVAAAARIVGLAALFSAAAAASVVGFAGAANAAVGKHHSHANPNPNANPNPVVGMYGNPAAAAPYWRLQHSSDCGEMAVADVVGQITGHEPTEQQITGVAESTPSSSHPGPIWFPNGETSNGDLPALLAHYGIQGTAVHTNIGALEQDLAQGDKVIAGVDGPTIWNQPGNRTQENHFVVVTGIDTKAGVVHLNDSGVNNGRDEQVPIATFEQAWATSYDFAVVSN